MITIALINGPNLNTLGTRQPEIYGTQTLAQVEEQLLKQFSKNVNFTFFQSNHEGELIDFIQNLKNIDGIIINPGAFTHTSIALRDAVLAADTPIIEVHISNIFRRENFRAVSYFSDIAEGIICGMGTLGYTLATLRFLEEIS
ncbi:MAG: type II 3-dehydroquinate dehydratase [Myxococcales bacterium]|nr:type II 3-dehydroquinate dehydratase [Myxococcales bacterium]USN51514.1 MAG: type II 3-dehydroquinate dehydratase [Myxococcales bacterium]